jgi:pyruvate dehydrogenase E2 component (dihydrolipoamide acetyltransferase)
VSNIGSLIYGKTANQNLTVSLIEIVPPQTIALGFSGIQEKPGVVINENGEKEIAIRSYMPITIVFDHRPFDFEALIPFIKKIDDSCTNPEIIAEWMK